MTQMTPIPVVPILSVRMMPGTVKGVLHVVPTTAYLQAFITMFKLS